MALVPRSRYGGAGCRRPPKRSCMPNNGGTCAIRWRIFADQQSVAAVWPRCLLRACGSLVRMQVCFERIFVCESARRRRSPVSEGCSVQHYIHVLVRSAARWPAVSPGSRGLVCQARRGADPAPVSLVDSIRLRRVAGACCSGACELPFCAAARDVVPAGGMLPFLPPDAAARICTVCIARAGVALQAAGDGWQCDGAPSPDRCQWAVDPRLSCSRPSLSTPPRPVCDVRLSLPTASPACIQLSFVGAYVAFGDGAITAI